LSEYIASETSTYGLLLIIATIGRVVGACSVWIVEAGWQ
jgi:hypothetical protein